jgi:hypothetical protein
MTTRDRILEIAASKIGNYGKGSPEVFAIWRDVLPPNLSDTQVHQFCNKEDWCGGFVLYVLREAGITTAHWHISDGILAVLPVKQVPWPKPGDIAIKEKPFGHHMLVEWWNNDNDWGDIAGNTPFAARHRHGSSVGITYYSIDPLLHAADTEPSPALPVLRMGSHGPDVAELQRLLGIKDDGSFGPKTAAAVMNFQRSNGLDADGICGPLTWGKLHDRP